MKNILVVGLGEVGFHLAKVLVSEGHHVTVIDADPDKLRGVSDSVDVQAVQGDGSRPDVLDKADAHSADLLLAVSNSDKVNMLTCLFGKRMGAKTTVLRLKDTAPLRGSPTFFRKNLMFDLLLSLEDLAAEEIVKTIRQNQAVGVESFAEGKIQMRRLRMSEDSSLLEVPLKDMKVPHGVLLAAIDRDHEVIIPGGDDMLTEDDYVFVVGEPKALGAFEKKLGTRATYLRDVVMYGSSGIVRQVFKALKRLHVNTRIIIEDRAEAEALSEELEGATVLHGTGTDLSMLREEHVGDADAFLGLSDQDEKNLMSCQLAKNLNVARTVALVHKPDYASIYEQLGVDVAVSPRLICADRILSFIRAESVSTIASIEEGKAVVLELEVKAGSKVVGKTLAKAGFPRGAVIAAIAREDGDVVIPRGETEIRSLDNLVIFALQGVVDAVMSLLGAKRG
ncbi:MAG: Trk system potassium transporter TrkA [Planctomycetota bacterium]